MESYENDEILWSGLMEGNQDMFLALYRKYYHSLLFIGLKEIRDAHLVKDAIQQQFLYLWEKRAGLQMARNVKAYLVTSFLRKLSSDWKRAEKKDQLQIAWSQFDSDPQITPEEKLIRKDGQTQLRNLLMQQINALPARQKELILFRFYEGLSYEEIVQRTKLTHRTVYNKIHEALKKLKIELEPEKEKELISFGMVLSLLCFLASFLVF